MQNLFLAVVAFSSLMEKYKINNNNNNNNNISQKQELWQQQQQQQHYNIPGLLDIKFPCTTHCDYSYWYCCCCCCCSYYYNISGKHQKKLITYVVVAVDVVKFL